MKIRWKTKISCDKSVYLKLSIKYGNHPHFPVQNECQNTDWNSITSSSQHTQFVCVCACNFFHAKHFLFSFHFVHFRCDVEIHKIYHPVNENMQSLLAEIYFFFLSGQEIARDAFSNGRMLMLILTHTLKSIMTAYD